MLVREINIERSNKIVIEASEQSNRISVPEILKAQSLFAFLKTSQKMVTLFFVTLICFQAISKKFCLIESCLYFSWARRRFFSEKERQFIVEQKNTVPISLAKNILRSETAAIAATTILSFQLNFK